MGSLLPADASIPIIEVGKSWTLEQDMAISIIIGNVTCNLFLLSFCIDSMALMPRGVAAPLIPSRFAEIFIDTYLLLSSERLLLPKILFIIGDRSLDNFCDNPLFSSIEKSPSHIAYMAHNSKESLTALFEADSSPDKTLLGSAKHSEITLVANKIIQIIFIVKNMITTRKIWG